MNNQLRNPLPIENATQEQRLSYYDVIWRRKTIIVLCLLAGLSAGYWFYTESPKEYYSSCVLLIKERQTGSVTNSNIELERRDTIETQLHVIGSASVLTKAAADPALKKCSLEQLGVEDSAGSLALGFSAQGQRNSDTMLVSFKSHNPKHATAALRAIVLAYENVLRDSYQDIGQETADLIIRASENLEQKIIGKREEYANFRKEHGADLLIVDGQPANVHSNRLVDLLSQQGVLTSKKITLETELETLRKAPLKSPDKVVVLDVLSRLNQLSGGILGGPGSDGKVGGKEKAELELQKLTELLLTERALSSKFGDDHPVLMDVREKIELLTEINEKSKAEHQEKIASDSATREEGQSLLEMAKSPQECIAFYEGLLQRNIDRVSAELEVLGKEIITAKRQAQAVDAILVADVNHVQAIEQSESLNKKILARLDEINIIKDAGGTRANTLTPPNEAYQIGPSIFRFLSIAGFCGACVGIAIGYVLELGEGTFRTPADVVRNLELQILGQVPSIEARRVKRAPHLIKIPPTIIAAHQPSSSVAESFRAIRTALYFSGEGKQHQVIQITSPTPGDGKSTLSANLAVSIAKSGKRVLLVDADFRRPTLHKVFGANNDTGLTTFLADEINVTKLMPLDTEVAGLFLLPSGPGVSNPSELLSGAKMGEVIETLKSQFDFVIIDSPPVLAVTDPLAIAARVDCVILAIRISRGIQFSSKRAREALDRVGANILGVVINGFSRGSVFAKEVAKDYGYGYGYGGYGYTQNPYSDPYSKREEAPVVPALTKQA